jgi:hypothetical protein
MYRVGVTRQQMLAFRDCKRILKLHSFGRIWRHGHGLHSHIACADLCVDSDTIRAPRGMLVGKVKRNRSMQLVTRVLVRSEGYIRELVQFLSDSFLQFRQRIIACVKRDRGRLESHCGTRASSLVNLQMQVCIVIQILTVNLPLLPAETANDAYGGQNSPPETSLGLNLRSHSISTFNRYDRRI